MEAYPFMWAKNKHIPGWCCVAAPEFINQLDGAARHALLGAQTGTTLASGEVCVVRGHDPGSGAALDLFYRRRPSDTTDSAGRPVSLIEGFVLRQRDRALVISGEHFDDAQAKLQPIYERFKDATEWPTEASLHDETIDVRTIPGGIPVTTKESVSKRIPLPVPREKKDTASNERPAAVTKPKADPNFSLFDSFGFGRPGPAPPNFLESYRARGTGKSAPEVPRRSTSRTDDHDSPPDTEGDHPGSVGALVIVGGIGLIGLLLLLGMCSVARSVFG